MRRPLTHAEVLCSWRVDGELAGHTVQQTLQFVSELQDIADEQQRQRVLPAGFVPADCEPKWRTTLARWFGR